MSKDQAQDKGQSISTVRWLPQQPGLFIDNDGDCPYFRERPTAAHPPPGARPAISGGGNDPARLPAAPGNGVSRPPAAGGSGLVVGDVVQINSQEDVVRQRQRGHGEWADAMKQVRTRKGE